VTLTHDNHYIRDVRRSQQFRTMFNGSDQCAEYLNRDKLS